MNQQIINKLQEIVKDIKSEPPKEGEHTKEYMKVYKKLENQGFDKDFNMIITFIESCKDDTTLKQFYDLIFNPDRDVSHYIARQYLLGDVYDLVKKTKDLEHLSRWKRRILKILDKLIVEDERSNNFRYDLIKDFIQNLDLVENCDNFHNELVKCNGYLDTNVQLDRIIKLYQMTVHTHLPISDDRKTLAMRLDTGELGYVLDKCAKNGNKLTPNQISAFINLLTDDQVKIFKLMTNN